MEILNLPITNYAEDPARFFDFARFSGQTDDFIFCAGLHDWSRLKDLKITKNKKIVQLDLEEPNKFFASRGSKSVYADNDDCFEKIFTICPYTAKWLNEERQKNKRTAVFFPFNEELIPPIRPKVFDIIYTGHLVNSGVVDDIRQITKYNYRLVSGSNGELVTDFNVSYLSKLDLISQSKITLCHNLLYARPSQMLNIFKLKRYWKNKAFKFITPVNFIFSLFRKGALFPAPQIKSRTFEAAFCRSLILCKKDQFNIIENFFEPNKEFVYYEEGKLSETVDKILANYNNYLPIIENAYRRAIKEYTTKAFFEKYLKNCFSSE
jgi:hypothetical protein